MSIFKPGNVEIVQTLSFVGELTVGTNSLTIPSYVIPGDILILNDLAVDFTSPVTGPVWPVGFTYIQSAAAPGGSVNAGRYRFLQSYKVADAADANRVITGMNGVQADAKNLSIFRRRPDPIVSAGVRSADMEITDGNPAVQTLDMDTYGSERPSLFFAKAGCTASFSFHDSDFDFIPVGPDGRGYEVGTSNNKTGWVIMGCEDPRQDISVDLINAGDTNHLFSFRLDFALERNDFNQYQAGLNPASFDWKQVGNMTPVWQVQVDETAIGGQALRRVSWGGTGNSGNVWAKLHNMIRECSVLAIVKTGSASVNTSSFGLLVRSDGAATVGGYVAQLRDVAGVKKFSLGEASAWTFEVPFAWVANTKYAIRVRAQLTSIKAKVWAYGAAEPTVWNIDITDTTYTAGWVGTRIEAASEGQLEYLAVVVGTGVASLP